MRKVLIYAVWLILLSVLQPTLIRSMAIFDIAPDLFLCFVIMVGFFRGSREGAVCGAIFGLAYDLLIGRAIGVHAFIDLYLGFGAGLLGHRFFSTGKQLIGTVAIGVGTLISSLVYYLIVNMFSEASLTLALFRIGLLEGVYNMIIGFLLSYLLKKSFRWMEKARF